MRVCACIYMYVCMWHMKEEPAIKRYRYVCGRQGLGQPQKGCVWCVCAHTEAEEGGGCFWRYVAGSEKQGKTQEGVTLCKSVCMCVCPRPQGEEDVPKP